jgi:hypothetical protein
LREEAGDHGLSHPSMATFLSALRLGLPHHGDSLSDVTVNDRVQSMARESLTSRDCDFQILGLIRERSRAWQVLLGSLRLVPLYATPSESHGPSAD